MFYWFKRSDAWMRYEIRALSSGGFELTFTNEAGEEIVETFHDETALQARQEAFLRRLTNDGWTGPHGWVT